MIFKETNKVDIAIFDTTGATVEVVSPYYDMLGVKRIDFLAAARMQMVGANCTKANLINLRLLSATNATGGGSSGISSATAAMGKPSTGYIIPASAKANELFILFSTNKASAAAAATFSILGTKFTASTGAAGVAYTFACGSAVAATVVSEAFATCFNLANNTLSSVWQASTMANSAGIRVYPKDQNDSTYITATGSSVIICGVEKFQAHLGLEAQHGDGKRYVAIGYKSSDVACPVTITAIREFYDGPIVQKTIAADKSMSESTAK